ncbi:MAG: 50S ribosomal protein L28 [Kiritimatiellae bacterium]|nr:50S ribosomal protein L28 [Kiritimatiellia bacterium]MBR3221559.1 50S ribosomal protein L28 [Kiritimatiellia bacterium]
MSRVCEICGKGPSVGNVVVRKGSPKYKGGIGLHTTGITKRRFLPNLQSVRVADAKGNVRRMRVCTRCIKNGKVNKA